MIRMMKPSTIAPAERGPGSGSLFFRVFPSLMLPMFLGVVDQTIVATALPAGSAMSNGFPGSSCPI